MLIYCKMVGSAIVPINKANQHLSCKWSKREVLYEKLINVNQNFSNWQVVQKVSGAWKIYCNLWDPHCSRWSNCFISFLPKKKLRVIAQFAVISTRPGHDYRSYSKGFKFFLSLKESFISSFFSKAAILIPEQFVVSSSMFPAGHVQVVDIWATWLP